MTTRSQILSHPKYRPDIDGLRALAVLSVVLYHAFPARLNGGFVGVDIFFVISGYLISTIIFSNIESGQFSFKEFYARRIKRIFPALLAVLLSSFAFGWLALLADEFAQLGKHTVAGMGFVSNLVLWTESGYFDNAAESKPLLHLWSLGVEEQFYIFWPLLVWFSYKIKAGLLPITLAVVLGSFLLNVYGITQDAVATFYSPLTRFWEISIGSLIAHLTLHKRIDSTKFSSARSNVISAVGLALLICAITFTDDRYAFPGWWALLPVIGSGMVITAGAKSSINNIAFSNKVAVWFGLISFPLYLWHWPVLVFTGITVGAVSWQSRVGAIFISVVLAWATYRFIERYIRASSGYRYVTLLILAGIVLASVGAYVYIEDGLAGRSAVKNSAVTEEVRKQFAGARWTYKQNDICLNEYPYEDADELSLWFCMKSDNKSPTIILLGDSFANQLYPGFIRSSLLSHHTVLSIGNCGFAAPRASFVGDPNSPCYGDRAVRQRKFIDELVGRASSIKFAVFSGGSREPDFEYIERVRERIRFFESKGIQVVIVTPHITPGFHPVACFRTPLRPVAKDCTVSVSERKALYKGFRLLIDEISRSNPSVLFFEPNDVFCTESRCSFVRDGMPLHRDSTHMSEYASIMLQDSFTEWAKENLAEIFAGGTSPGI
jgi:peptidoglycan/LPS O-acetylase OafA/YrhL